MDHIANITGQEHQRPHNKRIAAVFIDLVGFSAWCSRIGDDSEHFLCLMRPFEQVFRSFSSRYYVKSLGDAALLVTELNGKHGPSLEQLLVDCCDMSSRIKKIIGNLWHPRPEDVQVRVFEGKAFKWINEQAQLDFYGKPVNTARKMHYVAREFRHVCHESIKERIGRSNRIEFNKIPNQKDGPDGIDPVDLRLLYAFKKKRKSKMVRKKNGPLHNAGRADKKASRRKMK